MWVEKAKSGNYKFVERYTDVYTGKERKVSVTLEKNNAQTRKLAEKLLQDKVDDILGKTKEVVHLSDLIEDYLSYQKITVKASTYNRNKGACKSLRNMLENVLVDKLTAKYVTSKFLQSGREPSTLNEFMIRFKALIRWGYKNDYIEDIKFLDKIEPFKAIPHRVKIQDKFLESSELELLLDNMVIDKWNLLTQFLVLSGMRIGEVIALNKEDVDLDARLIHINKNYDYINNVTTVPKTLCSIRDIFIQDELLVVCKKIIQLRGRLQLSGEMKRNDLFVPGNKEDHAEYFSYCNYLKDRAFDCLGRRITPHTLRHTHASLLMEQGIPIEVISRRLGHEGSQITKEIYLHVTEKLKEKDYAQIEKIKIFS